MPPKTKAEEEITEDFPYLQELMQAIAAVRHSIDGGSDGVNSAENLLAEIPNAWKLEIKDRLDAEKKRYALDYKYGEKYTKPGNTPTTKEWGYKYILSAGKRYSRNVVNIAISLFYDKNMLFKTKKKVAESYMSLYQLGETETDD